MIKKVFKIFLLLVLGLALLLGLGYWQRAEVFRLVVGLPPYQGHSQPPIVDRVAMRDGVELATEVYLPEGKGPWPVVLIRDPYSSYQILCQLFARYQLACVRQDTRGRYESGGDWYPVLNERNDGLDTIDWVLQQPWQNGRLATYGSSYVGLVQWAMIDDMPPAVKAVVADISHGDWYRIVQRHGHMVQGVASNWALSLHESTATMEQFVAHRPAVEANELFLKGHRQWFEDYLLHPAKNAAYWNSAPYVAAREGHKQAAMPVLMLAGWHDFFLEGQLRVFEELPRRAESLLLVRNGSHGSLGGLRSTLASLRLIFPLSLDWLRRHLRGQSNGTSEIAGYLLQDSVDDSYQLFDTWPEGEASTILTLQQLAAARSCNGGKLVAGVLNTEEASVTYEYDPRNPVPSRGGSYNLRGSGVVDQGSDLCPRPDVLSFASAPSEEGFIISGSIRVVLQVSSSAEDTAFTVKLQERLADGRVLNIRDDITSLGFRNGAGSRLDYEPGSPVELVFDLVPIRWRVQPGSSLRLDISSSNFPVYNAHPNVAAHWATTDAMQTATQTLYRGVLLLRVEK